MKKRFFKQLGGLLLGGLFLLAGCIQDATLVSKTSLMLLPLDGSTITVPNTGASGKIIVTANSQWSFTVTGANDYVKWISVDPSTVGLKDPGVAELKYTVEANGGDDARECKIEFTAGDQKAAITILQEGSILSVEKEEVSVDPAGEEGEIILERATRAWEVTSGAAWLKIVGPAAGDPVNVDPNDMGEPFSIAWKAEANPADSEREATVTFTFGTAGTKTITFKQEKAEITVTLPEGAVLELPSTAVEAEDGKTFSACANRAWTAKVTSGADWLSLAYGAVTGVEVAGEKGDFTINVVAKANPAASEREATVTLKAGNVVATLTVKQKAAGLTIPAEYADPGVAFEPYADSKNLTGIVATNGHDWDVAGIYDDLDLTDETEEPWIEATTGTLTPEGKKVVNIAAKANPKDSERTLYVKITCDDLVGYIKVVQKEAEFTVTPVTPVTLDDVNNIPAKGGAYDIEIKANNGLEFGLKEGTAVPAWITTNLDNLKDHDFKLPFILKINVKPNGKAAGREGTLYFQCGEMTGTLTVKQTGSTLTVLDGSDAETSEVEFPAAGGTGSFKVVATSGLEISYSDYADWLTVTPTEAGFDLKAAKNNTDGPRETKIKIKCGEVETEFTVKQVKPSAMTVAPDEVTLEAVANDIQKTTLTLSDNAVAPTLKWNTPDPDWVKATITEITAGGAKTYEISFTALTCNLTKTDKKNTLVISCGEPKIEVPVTQKAGTFDVSATPAAWENYKNTYTYNDIITSNVLVAGWECVKADPSQGWFTIQPSDNKLTVVVENNPTTEEREATLDFKIKGSDVLKKSLTFKQAAGKIELKATALDYKAFAYDDEKWADPVVINDMGGGETAATDWTAEITEGGSWISLQKIGADLLFDIAPNPDGTSREATLQVSYGDMTEKCTITQEGAEIKLVTDPTIDPSRYDIPARATQKLIVDPVVAPYLIEILPTNGMDLQISGTDYGWFKLAITKGDASADQPDQFVIYDVQANPKEQERYEKITIQYGNLSEELTIAQTGAKLNLVGGEAVYTVNLTDPKYDEEEDIEIIAECTGEPWSIDPLPADAFFEQILRWNDDFDQKRVRVYRIAANPDGTARETKCIIRSGEITRTLVIEQPGAQLTLNPTIVQLSKDGGSYTAAGIVSLDNGLEWEIDYAADWFTASKVSGSRTDIQFVGIAPNETNKLREAELTVRSNSLVGKILVQQASANFALNKKEVTVDAKPAVDPLKVMVLTKPYGDNQIINWSIGELGSDAFARVRKHEPNTLEIYDIETNMGETERTMLVPIVYDAQTLYFTVKQKAAEILLNFTTPVDLTCDDAEAVIANATATEDAVTVTNGADWEVAKKNAADTWFEVEKSVTGGVKNIRVVKKINLTKETRSGVVVVTSGSLKKEFTLTQAAATFSISLTQAVFDPKAGTFTSIANSDKIPAVTSEDPNWFIEPETTQKWAALTRVGDDVRLDLKANPKAEDRATVFDFYTSDRSMVRKYVVKQKAAKFVVTYENLTIPADGTATGTGDDFQVVAKIKVTSGLTDWNAEKADPADTWYEFTKQTVATGGIGIRVTAGPNTGTAPRTAKIKITVGQMEMFLTITQEN